ncbi:MFS transporter [Paenibacillus sp. MER TA 81-3]|uniref:MFS transporter n=1 Tax=Paenibacillus sp. MER TA 81-3 TaxID=2939573 RepID=UPI002040DFDE|nr:MFS transporter [Paenibacillus sp. MER TA 81-3]MCM3340955.1 MFS transporter [Paenibacillus sp. MER TA 81-3]
MSRVEENKSAVPGLQDALKADRLPIWRLLAFTMAGFIAILTETMPAGLLPQISRDLGVSEAMSGQLVSLYALGSVVAAIPLIAATRRWRRKRVLLLAIGGLFLFNTATVLSADYVLTLIARFVAGMAAALIWGLLAGYVRRMVPNHLQGRALAIAGVGQPIALSLGIPLGAWLGTLFDWRGIFGIISALTLALIVWVVAAVPDYPGQAQHERQPIRKIFMTPGVRPVLLVLFVWMLAHNILYTYIAPFMAFVGLANRLGLVLLIFGFSSVIGIWITGQFIDARLRFLTLISLATFAVVAMVLGLASELNGVTYLGVSLWGLTFGGAPTLLQTAIADAAGEGADVAQSMLVTIFNLAVAGGGIVGGLLLEQMGAGSFPWTLAFLSLVGLLTVWACKNNAFKPDRRSQGGNSAFSSDHI